MQRSNAQERQLMQWIAEGDIDNVKKHLTRGQVNLYIDCKDIFPPELLQNPMQFLYPTKMSDTIADSEPHNWYWNELYFTPFQLAVLLRKDELVAYFVENGGRLNIANSIDVHTDCLPIYCRSRVVLPDLIHYSSIGVSTLLLHSGLDPNMRGRRNDTVLHTVLMNPTIALELVPLIIKKGGDVNAKNRYGFTPISILLDKLAYDHHRALHPDGLYLQSRVIQFEPYKLDDALRILDCILEAGPTFSHQIDNTLLRKLPLEIALKMSAATGIPYDNVTPELVASRPTLSETDFARLVAGLKGISAEVAQGDGQASAVQSIAASPQDHAYEEINLAGPQDGMSERRGTSLTNVTMSRPATPVNSICNLFGLLSWRPSTAAIDMPAADVSHEPAEPAEPAEPTGFRQ